MKKFLLLAPCVALTFACSGAGNNSAGNTSNTVGAATTGAPTDAANGSASGAAAPVTGGTPAAGGVTMQPGRWEFTTVMTNIEMPGAPPQAQQQMQAQMGREQKQAQCLTQHDVTNIAQKMAQQGGQGGQCDFERQTYGGGTIDIAGTCRSPQGNVQIAMTGNYTATTTNMTTNINLSGGQQQMRMSGRVSGRRLGDC
jgi:hypothetical protein